VLIVLSAVSTLEDEFERLRLDAWLVEMLLLVAFRVASILDDEFDKIRLDV